MSLDESRFATLADATLSRLAEAIDDALGDMIDVELESGILTFALPQGGQYVVNKHAPNRQLWLSSPVSGAFHFGYADGDWVSTRDAGVSLVPLLVSELKAKMGVEVAV
jgi:frataxin